MAPLKGWFDFKERQLLTIKTTKLSETFFTHLNLRIGVQEAARDSGRVVVSGHAPHVGIIGWSLGGGHGQLVPMLGMGVDQVQ
jgi:hypothetical protein